MNTAPRDAELDRRLARTPIAIVGLAGLFPRARNVRAYWSNIVAGADCIEEVPADRWRLDDYYDPDPAAPDKSYCRRGGFLPEVQFSPLEFGLPPNTLEVTDILQLLSQVVARDLLQDAGCDAAGWYDARRTGVIVGVTCSNALIQPLVARLQTPVIKEVVRSCGLSEHDAEQVAAKFTQAYIPWEENSFPGMLANLVAGRIANRFNFGATNCTVDAACASSLAAIKMSISELLEGRADLMVSGGCDAENTIFMYMCFSKTPAFSKSGVIRPFDADADGTLIGEGIGLLALKRLSDAERDEDRIYAVIRGIGTASDGRFKSIYAPRAAGQVTCLDRAYADADCSPASIGLVEAHGTGTAVGDATELSALGSVFGAATEERQYVAVGSVKSQIGHTKAAAGAAGMIKLALALHHKVLPPTINVRTPAVAIDFASTPFYVNTETNPWIREPEWPRRAAVSAFGFGGTDFHMVLEEHENGKAHPRALHPTARAYLWHAADPDALAHRLDAGAAAAEDGPIPAGDARIGFACGDDDLAGLLDLARAQLAGQGARDVWSHPRGIFYRRRAAAPQAAKAAALFAGQGSQYVGMGRAAALNVPPVRATFDEVNRHFAGTLPLSRVMFPPPGTGSGEQEREELLRRTEYAQPAICALAAGQFRFLSELGFAPDGLLGHSLGELTALWAAGCLSDEDLFRLARCRGESMAPVTPNGRDPGAMAVITSPEVRVRELLAGHDGLVICNYNAPDQLVIGGATAAVDDLVARCGQQEVKAQRLAVSAAFHTSFVEHAARTFGPAVERAQFRPPARPIYANTSGAVYGDDLAANRRILTEQILHPVHFAPQVQAMYRDGFRVFVEFGPKRALSRLVSATLSSRDDVLVYAVDGGPGQDSDVHLKRVAVELAVLGLPLTGLNRYSAEPEIEHASSKLSIPITGVNIVSEQRRAAYRDAIENGYEVARPAAATAPAVPERPAVAPQPVDPPELVPSRIVPARRDRPLPAADGLVEVAREHLELHANYLEGQLRTADYLTELAGRPGSNGEVSAIAEAIKEHGLALGRTHTRASEILRDLAGTAAPGPVAPAPIAPTPIEAPAPYVPAPPPAPPPTPLPAPEPGPVEAPPSPAPAAPSVADDLLAIVADKTGYPADMLELGMEMEADLGIDSIKRVEILGGLRERYPQAAAGPEEMAELRTLADVVALIAPEASVPAPAPADPAHAPADGAAVAGHLLAIVADKTGYPADMLELGMEMEADLGIDSIKRVEILGGLRERYPQAAAGPEEMAELRTLADVVALVGAPAAAPATAPPPPAEAATDPVAVVRLHPRLTSLPALERQLGVYTAAPIAVLVDDGSALCPAVAGLLSAAGWEIAVLRLPDARPRHYGRYRVWDLTTWDEQDLEDAGAALTGVTQVELCLYLAAEVPVDHRDAMRRLAHAVLVAKHIQEPLIRAAQDARSAFVTVSRLDGAFGLDGAPGESAALFGGLQGLVKTMAIEAPGLFCRALDIAPAVDDELAAQLIVDELHDFSAEPVEVGRDGARRRTITLTGTPPDRAGPVLSELGADDLFVVSGGARGVTAACVKALIRRTPCHLVLLGRTALGEEPDWAVLAKGEAALKAAAADHIRAAGEQPTPREVDRLTRDLLAQREIRATLSELRDLGAATDYVAVDVTDRAATAAALAFYNGRISGIVHGAGVLADRLIADKTASEAGWVLAAKLDGLHNLLAGIDPDRLRHLVLFSSVAGFYGNRGQVDYAMANAALNTVALGWKQRHPACHVTAVDWGAWAGGMVTPQLRQLFEQRGVGLIPVEVGAGMFAEQFTRDRVHDVVTVIAPPGPLSARPTRPPPAGPVVVERSLAALADEAVIIDHSVDGSPVFPATAALGWCVNVLERLHPGMTVAEAWDFKVFKGIIFGKDDVGAYQLEATPKEPYDGSHVEVKVRDGRTPHFGGAFRLVAKADPIPVTIELGDLTGEPADERSPYEDGTLFHGPALRGFQRALVQEPGRLVAEHRLDEVPLADGAYEGRLYDSVLSDMMPQTSLVWVRRFRDSGCLPVSIGRVRIHDRIPYGTPFLVVVEEVEDRGSTVSCTVTACSRDGHVYQTFTGLTVALRQKQAPKSG